LSYAYKPGAARFEFLEANVANRLGLGAAIDVILDVGIGLIESRRERLGRLLRKRLGGVPGIKVYHDRRALNVRTLHESRQLWKSTMNVADISL
jgi:selenocysteine lyase/cysteine desulfurase